VSHGFEIEGAPVGQPTALPGIPGALERGMGALNRLIMAVGGVALIGAALVLTYSVVVRYILKIPTDWQDETAVFLLIGATFLCAASVQARRGHIGIEAFATLLSPATNRIRLLVVDILSLAFCAFFAWKSWTLLHEAWVDDQHSTSSWGPPLWVPYLLMASGMTLLSAQILVQIVADFARREVPSLETDGLGGAGPLTPETPVDARPEVRP
jgi:TRAP-type C4-dicarboxylate transport system permease small subunit